MLIAPLSHNTSSHDYFFVWLTVCCFFFSLAWLSERAAAWCSQERRNDNKIKKKKTRQKSTLLTNDLTTNLFAQNCIYFQKQIFLGRGSACNKKMVLPSVGIIVCPYLTLPLLPPQPSRPHHFCSTQLFQLLILYSQFLFFLVAFEQSKQVLLFLNGFYIVSFLFHQ